MSLTVLITNADGAKYRLGPDEPDAAWIPENINWESTVPGGWKSGSFNLRRRIDEDVPLRLLDEVEIVDEHGQNVYEGRIQQLPRQHGDDFLLGVNCLGWAAHLLDDKSFSRIFRDMDLGRWGDASLQRRLNVLTSGRRYDGAGSLAASPSGLPALVNEINGPWGAGIDPISEAVYDAGAGNRIANVYYAWQRLVNLVPADVNWTWDVALGDNDVFTAFDTSGNLRATGPGSGTVTAAGPRRYATAQLGYTTGAGVEGQQQLGWTTLAVHGDHGLTKHGTEPDAGFYIDDMLGHALATACPKLNFTTGTDGSIERPPLIISQATFPEPGSVEAVVLDLNKYVLWDWLVYENRTFFYRPTDPARLTWEARLDQGIHLSLEGDDAEHAYNGCMVRFTLHDGTKRVVGPPGSGFDTTSALLADTDPENTVNAHNYPRRWIELDVQFPLADDLYAVTIGSAYLLQASLPSRSGDITLVGHVEHPTKGLRPVCEVRAGDWIRLSDHPADVPRRIVSARYTHDQLQTVVTVGNDMNKIDALLEQLGVVTRVRLGA